MPKMVILSYIVTFLPCEGILCFCGEGFVLLAGVLELLLLNHAVAFPCCISIRRWEQQRAFQIAPYLRILQTRFY